MSNYVTTVNGNAVSLTLGNNKLALTVNQNSQTLSLSRTGGQGSKGDSIQNVQFVNNSLIITIVKADGTTYDIDAGSFEENVTLDGLNGVTIDTPAEGEFLLYDSASSEWKNQEVRTSVVSATAPTSPIEGDLWYDLTNNALNTYNGTAFVTSGYRTLEELEDVTLSSLVAGDYIEWDGTTWVNTNFDSELGASSIDGLSDVDTSTVAPVDKQVLIWDANTSMFLPADAPMPLEVSLGNWNLGSLADNTWHIQEGSNTVRFEYGLYVAMSADNTGQLNISGDLLTNETVGGPTIAQGSTEWAYHVSGTNFYFQYGPNNLVSLDSAGQLKVTGDLNTNATLTGYEPTSYYFYLLGEPKLEITSTGVVNIATTINTNEIF